MSLGSRLAAVGWTRRSSRRRRWLAAVAPAALAAGCVSDLGTLGGNRSGGAGINEHGVTVGWSETGTGTVRAFRRPPGGPMIALEGTGATAAAVNDAGVVVGSATVDGGGGAAVIWDAEGTLHSLADLGLDLDPAVLVDINDDGVAVGVRTAPERVRAFLLDIDTATVEFLPFALHDNGAEDHQAHAINDAGAVVGEVCSESRGCRAVLWRAGSHEPVLLGAPEGWIAGVAVDVDDHGTVVGQIVDATRESTVLWRPGSYDDPALIEPPEGKLFTGRSINDRGQVVGTLVAPMGPGGLTAAVWDARTGAFTGLGGLGGRLSLPVDINDAGLAIGTASTPDGSADTHAVLYHTRR